MSTYSYSGSGYGSTSTSTLNYEHYNGGGKSRLRKESLVQVTCGHCDNRMMARESNKSIMLCVKCKEYITYKGDPIGAKFFNEHADDSVKLNTHIQVKWRCRSCGAAGIRWREKKNFRQGLECRECGETNLMTHVLPTKGQSKNIWQGRTKPVQIPYMILCCPDCGQHHQYSYHRPANCTRCGYDLPSEEDSES